MATTNIQTFSGDVEIVGGLSVTGTVTSTVGTDKVNLAATTTNETDYIPVSKGATGAQALYTDSNLTYNPSTNQIGANISGNAAFATNATFATSATHANNANTVAFTDRDTTSETDYIAFVSSHVAGDYALYTDSNLTYNPSTNQLAANLSGNVTGNLTGDVTGNVSGNAAFATNATYATSAGSATNATFATSATHANNANTVAFTDRDTNNETDYIAFVSSHVAGDYALYTDQNLTYNPSTNQLAANLSGNVTGNVSGNAAFATNATYANNAGNLGGVGATTSDTGNTIAKRDGSGDLYTRLFRSTYQNQNTISGAMAYRVSTNDNYTRFCSDTSAIRTYLNVPTRTGGNASGTWGINVNGNAAFATNATYANSAGSATNATFATSATHANAANTVAFTDRDSSNNTDYIAFVDSHAAGDKALYTDQNLTYNSSTNHINANVPYATSAGSASCPAFFDATHTANVAANALYNFDLHHVRIPSNMTLNTYFYAPIAGYYYFTFSGLNAYAPYAANVGWEKQGNRYPSTNDSDYIIDYYSAHASRRITSSVIMYLGVGHTASLKRISGTGQGGSNRYTGFFLSY